MSALLPAPYAADERLRAEGYRLLDDECAQAFGDGVEALVEISGMRRFGHGAEGRPASEWPALAGAEEKLGGALAILRRRLAAQNGELLDRVEELVAKVESGVVHLAADLAASLRGRVAPAVEQIEAISLIMLERDLRAEA